MSVITGVITAILFFLLLIICHELGHLIAAKLCNVCVEEFSVGMGPLIFKKQKGETQYSVRAVPIGGYCKLESEDQESDDPRAFVNAKWWKKIIILAAGAFNNIVLCLIVLVFVFTHVGYMSPILDTVTAGSPADLAGIRAGDEIVAVDGIYYSSWTDIADAIGSSEGEIEVRYLRDSKEYTAIVTAEYSEELGRNLIGISASIRHDPGKAFATSLATCKSYYVETFKWFISIFQGKAKSDDVVGVVGMVSMASEEAKLGWENLVYFMAMISLNLGVVNLLPFPALDGGRIVFVILRLITGNKIGQKLEYYVNAAGLILLVGLMIFMIFRDTINLIV